MDVVVPSSSDDSQVARITTVTGSYDQSTLRTTSYYNKYKEILKIRDYKQLKEEDYLRMHPEYRLAEDIRLYLPMLFVIVGTFGNLLSLIVLLRPRMRTKSTFAFLTVLAVADTAVLFFVPFRIWVGILTEDVFMEKSFVCKSIAYLGHVFSEFSAGILVLVTVERFIVIKNPLEGPLMCSVRRAYVAMGVLLTALATIHMHLLWTIDIHVYELHNHNVSYCAAVDGYEILIENIWPWVDISLYSLVPFVVIMILNVLIIGETRRAGKARQKMGAGLKRYTSVASQDDTSRLTFMLLTLTFTFLVTTMPLCVTSIVNTLRLPYTTVHNARSHEELAQQELARALTQLLMFANHSINFFLYCLTGNKFKQELVQLIPWGQRESRKRQARLRSTTDTVL